MFVAVVFVLAVCLSVCLSVCLFVWLFFSQSVSLSVCAVVVLAFLAECDTRDRRTQRADGDSKEK